ncbi:hypothetical protein [Picosynechococcus sp. PCC 8807]|uniref:hypothetical protein n=1 Tax=Picosynechococcus sp. PCC 8807 TaxID=195248 RepID=UPI0008107208|nr:hypothetical protein [Picosynechococcus sp. PCC 8807]ANV92100.1 hypothetical protein AWQ24_15080 [Picosynechococcus sp. PCC 8807]
MRTFYPPLYYYILKSPYSGTCFVSRLSAYWLAEQVADGWQVIASYPTLQEAQKHLLSLPKGRGIISA